MVYKSFDGGIKEQQKEMLNIKIRADFNNTDSKVYLCSIDTDGELQWINGTKEDSFVDRVGPDGFATFTFDSFNFHSFIPALILEQDGNYSRKNALKVYSLSYEYEDNIRRG